MTWFTLSNFIAPLVALSFYYVKICAKIRRNLRAKKRMLPANANIVNPLIKLSSGSSSTMELSSTLPGIQGVQNLNVFLESVHVAKLLKSIFLKKVLGKVESSKNLQKRPP